MLFQPLLVRRPELLLQGHAVDQHRVEHALAHVGQFRGLVRLWSSSSSRVNKRLKTDFGS